MFSEKLLLGNSRLLQKTEILSGDFVQVLPYTDNHSFVYFDPPYLPISKTSSFKEYTKEEFGMKDHLRLAAFCRVIDTFQTK